MRRDIFPEPRLPIASTASLLELAHSRWDQSKTAHTWQIASSEVFDNYLLPSATYFLLYEHPVHTYLNRGYQTLGQSLKEWLDKQMELNGEVGLDIWILPEHQDWIIGCNHNGNIFSNKGAPH